MTYDDYRYEMPDFILGKSSPEIARAMNRLIETDAAFRAEFLEMKSLIDSVTPSLNDAFERATNAPPSAYFDMLSKKVLARAVPKKTTWWQVIKSDIAFLVETSRWQWAGGMVGATLSLVFIVFATELDGKLNDGVRQKSLANTGKQSENQPTSLVATNHFAMGSTPELVIAQIDEHEVEEVLNILENKFPTRKPTYKVLTEDEAELLFKPM